MRRCIPLLLAVCACDPQADSGYLGEPLVTLSGQVISSGALPPLEAAMLWQRGPPPSTNDQELATRAPVQTGFPASFTVHLYQPAPLEARRTLLPGEPVFARANAAAVPYGIGKDDVAALPSAASPGYGIDAAHWVIYLPADVPAASLTAYWLGAALPAGFHLMRVAAIDPKCIPQADLDACVAEAQHRGLSDPAQAKLFCQATFRLTPAPPGEQLVLDLGAVGIGAGGGACP